jgi:hypothetical protein
MDACQLCLAATLAAMVPPEPPTIAPGSIDTHAAVMHLVRQQRPATTPEQRQEVLDMVPDYLGGPDLTRAAQFVTDSRGKKRSEQELLEKDG